ncbi:MAG: hypothetical protein HC798_02525 [Polaribacter sp.]|nr:hypothetical protein [Polaribacter sp.]
MMQNGMTMSYNSTKSDEELDAFGKQMKVQMSPMLEAIIKMTTTPLGENKNIEITPDTAISAADMANQGTVIYPENELSIGDSWDFSKDTNGLITTAKYTVDKIDTTTVTATISGIISGIGEGSMTGILVIDRISGMPKDSEINMKIKVQGMDSTTTVKMTSEN